MRIVSLGIVLTAMNLTTVSSLLQYVRDVKDFTGNDEHLMAVARAHASCTAPNGRRIRARPWADAVIVVTEGFVAYARVLAVLSFEADRVAYLWVRWYESFDDDAARRLRRGRRSNINKYANPAVPGLACMQWQQGTASFPAKTDIVDAKHVITVPWVVQNEHDDLWYHCLEPWQVAHHKADLCEGLEW